MLKGINGLGEFAFLEKLLSGQGSATGSDVVVGPGDDCAALEFGDHRSELMLMATDAIVEDVHFSASAYSFAEIGRKSLVVNLSDIAAMGGTPLFATVAAAVPPGMHPADLTEMLEAVDHCASEYELKLVGGDLTKSDKISLCVSIVGSCPRDSIVPRGGSCRHGHDSCNRLSRRIQGRSGPHPSRRQGR